MSLPDYLVDAGVSQQPLDYDWDTRIQNGFLAADADRKPKLAKVLDQISYRAMFGLNVALAEWIAARLAAHIDVTDALLRTEAAWAACIDPRYARLPKPAKPAPDSDRTISAPLYLSQLFLMSTHEACLTVTLTKLWGGTFSQLLLAEHVIGRHPAFKDWLPVVFKRAQAWLPEKNDPFEQQAPVVRELFLPGWDPAKADVAASQATVLAGLDPDRNPYLRPASELIAEGVSSHPYPGKP